MDFLLLILGLYLSWRLLRAFLSMAYRGKSGPAGKLPPGPRPLPVIGSLLQLRSRPHKSLTKLTRLHGPVMSLKVGCVTNVLVSSAPVAREILQTHDDSFSDHMAPDAVTALREDELGLPWIPVFPLWRNLRHICSVHLFARTTPDSNRHICCQKILVGA